MTTGGGRCAGCWPGPGAGAEPSRFRTRRRRVGSRPVSRLRKLIASWPVARQLTGEDPLGLGAAARSARTASLTPRTETADKVVGSVCPYCAVGCGQLVYVKDERVTQIEGDPASPVSRGRLCPKGAASEQLVNSTLREYKVKYRRPHSTRWEALSLDQAMDMIAD